MSRSVTCCDMFVTRCVMSPCHRVWAIIPGAGGHQARQPRHALHFPRRGGAGDFTADAAGHPSLGKSFKGLRTGPGRGGNLILERLPPGFRATAAASSQSAQRNHQPVGLQAQLGGRGLGLPTVRDGIADLVDGLPDSTSGVPARASGLTFAGQLKVLTPSVGAFTAGAAGHTSLGKSSIGARHPELVPGKEDLAAVLELNSEGAIDGVKGDDHTRLILVRVIVGNMHGGPQEGMEGAIRGGLRHRGVRLIVAAAVTSIRKANAPRASGDGLLLVRPDPRKDGVHGGVRIRLVSFLSIRMVELLRLVLELGGRVGEPSGRRQGAASGEEVEHTHELPPGKLRAASLGSQHGVSLRRG